MGVFVYLHNAECEIKPTPNLLLPHVNDTLLLHEGNKDMEDKNFGLIWIWFHLQKRRIIQQMELIEVVVDGW